MKNLLLIVLCMLAFGNTKAQIARADSIKAATYIVRNLSANSKYQDFGTVFYGKDKVVFSSSRRSAGVANKIWKQNNQPFLDLYIGDLHANGEIVKVKPFSSDVNSKYHDAFVAFTPDMKEVYFTSNNYLDGKLKSENIKIFRATINEKGHWTDIVTLPFNSDDYDTGHPALSADGKKLYFVSDMPGTLGDKDIFVVDINNGHYGKPVNLGPTINSPAKEFTPFIDGDVIYFSSNRKGGKGGFDIYMTKLDGSLPKPINLGEPMNSEADDFSFIIDSEKLKGYFSSNRARGVGDDDIYAFEQRTVNPICDQIITGIVKDKVSGLRVQNAFVALIDEQGNQLRKVETKFDGSFYFTVDCARSYTLEITKEDYFGNTVNVTTSNKNGYENNEVIFIEEKEFVVRNGHEMLNVQSINFELNSHEINPSSEQTLERVVKLMKKYPEMVIEFGAHTDARGGDAYNLNLTKGRARATVDYLLRKGISPKRLTGKGYGETQILNKCVNGVKCTELEHSVNKRTEFVVIKK
ncbi:OmpA family protein [Flavobacteriaceae bacterium F08102]|nr:OmpA family protein [Flavobacteriaceae bacterium F08102]